MEQNRGKAATIAICCSVLFYIVHGAPSFEGNCDSTQCPKYGITKFYSEVNCQPIHEDGSCCPVRYDCSSFSSRDANKCYFGGKEYGKSSTVPTNITMPSCIAGCICNGGQNGFICAYVDCAEFFGAFGIPDPSCYHHYSLDSCCSRGMYCPKSPGEVVFQCEYEGQVYKKGQRFYTKDKCKKCICEEGYDGTTNGPWCSKIQCTYELLGGRYLGSGCVPVYLKDSCCPNNWQCPSENDQIIEGPNHTIGSNRGNQNGLSCTYGNLTLDIGDKLRLPGLENTDCVCSIPPYLSCTLTPKERA